MQVGFSCYFWQNDFIMIEQLSSMEQMEYIEIMASLYIPDPTVIDPIETIPATEEQIEQSINEPFGMSECVCIFKNRYNCNAFTKLLIYEDYIKDSDIQKLIQHLELDADKFWLLILFAYDCCTDKFRQGETMKLSPLEQVQRFIEIVEQTNDRKMSLTFKVEKQKMETELEIDTDAIRFIAKAISDFKVDNLQELKQINYHEKADKSKYVANSPLLAYFAKMLLMFFNTQENIRDKRKKGAKHSKKEMDLVSRLVYFTGLSYNERLKDIEDEYLKGFLKQYKDYKYPNKINRVYPSFYF